MAMGPRTLLGLVLPLLLVGCGAPPYQKLGTGFYSRCGYEDFEVGKGVFFVAYTEGVDDGTIAKATQRLHQRAKEVCLEHGFSGYELLDKPINAARGESNNSISVPMANGMSYGIGLNNRQPHAESYVKCVNE